MDYVQLIDAFFLSLSDMVKACSFLGFCARHPDLSADNAALLYLQVPNASGILVPADQAGPGQGRERGCVLLGVCRQENTLTLMPRTMVPLDRTQAAAERDPDRSFRGIFNRLGMALVFDKNTACLTPEPEAYRLRVPDSWNEEQMFHSLCGLLVDMFWEKFKPSLALLQRQQFLFDVTEAAFRQHYRDVLVYMVEIYLGAEGSTLSKTFLPFIAQDSPLSVSGISFRRYRWNALVLLHSEFAQMAEGRHFTLYETDIFRCCEGRFSDRSVRVAGKDSVLLDPVYLIMLERYADGAAQIDRHQVRYDLPFRADDRKNTGGTL